MRVTKFSASMPISTGTPFSALPLTPALQVTLTELGWHAINPLQAAVLPEALAGRDLIVQAPPGSGRTVAFTVALLHRLDPRRFDVQALVLCPTRERVQHVAQRIRDCVRAARHVKVVALMHGAAMRPQIDSLIHGAHVVVGTPGRVVDHLDAGSLDLRAIGILVIDDAESMLDLGLVDDVGFAASRCPKSRQTLLFSTSFDSDLGPEVARFSRLWLRKPRHIVHLPD